MSVVAYYTWPDVLKFWRLNQIKNCLMIIITFWNWCAPVVHKFPSKKKKKIYKYFNQLINILTFVCACMSKWIWTRPPIGFPSFLFTKKIYLHKTTTKITNVYVDFLLVWVQMKSRQWKWKTEINFSKEKKSSQMWLFVCVCLCWRIE